MHCYVEERAGEQEEKREIAEQVYPVLTEEEVGQHRSEGSNGKPAKKAGRIGRLGHDSGPFVRVGESWRAVPSAVLLTDWNSATASQPRPREQPAAPIRSGRDPWSAVRLGTVA